MCVCVQEEDGGVMCVLNPNHPQWEAPGCCFFSFANQSCMTTSHPPAPSNHCCPPPHTHTPPLQTHINLSCNISQIRASDCFVPILARLSPDSARLSRSSMVANDGKGIVLCNSPQPGSGAGLLCQTIPVC